MYYLLVLTFVFTTFAQDQSPSEDEVWAKVYSGEYTIVIPEENLEDSLISIKTDSGVVQVKRDFKRLMKAFHYIDLSSGVSSKTCNEVNEAYYLPNVYSVKDSCAGLEGDPKELSAELLYYCLDGLRKSIYFVNDNEIDRETILGRMFDIESEAQREFLGAVLTAYGEGRSGSDEEIAMIIKTLENRKLYARETGCTKTSILDIALQRKQYSMWNSGDPNWRKVLSLENEEPSESRHLKRIINVYVKYRKGEYKFRGSDQLLNVYHYRTKDIKYVPKWGTRDKALKYVIINNKNIGANRKDGSHYFFRNVPWSFRFNYLRRQDDGEEECY